MSIITPNVGSYDKSVSLLIQHFNSISEDIHWAIYGSFINGKIRPGLSDIDVFAMLESDDVLFPIELGTKMGDVKSEIEGLGIPLKISKTTTSSVQNSFTAPDFYYLKEVMRGIESGHSSGDFSNYLSELRNSQLDDISAARLFFRSMSELGSSLHKIHPIIQKDISQISKEDQQSLRFFWDHFKKSLSFYTISLRILLKKSYFSKNDGDILSALEDNFSININIGEYLNILGEIKGIEDWYEFLKNGGLGKIQEIYNAIFIPTANTIAEKLGN